MISCHMTDVHDVLDICCGSGQWAIDVRNSYFSRVAIGSELKVDGEFLPQSIRCWYRH